MTVASEVRSVEYDGDDSAAEFPVPFEVLDPSHLRVTYYPASGAAVVLTNGVDPGGYTYGSGDTVVRDVYPVTASTPAPTGSSIVVERVVPVTQTVDLTNQGTFDAETHEEIADLGVMVDQQLLDRIKALESAGAPGSVLAGNGLEFGGDLVTLHVVANGDGSIISNANDVQVGVLATDAQHGVRGGGTQHAVATGASAGFQSATDKTRADALWGRTVTAGAGMTGGGALSANITLDVVAADESISVGANSIAVGVINASQHGAQTDETLHAVATTTTDGFMSAEDKAKLDGLAGDSTLSVDGGTAGKTTDATPTAILTWTPDDDSVEQFEVQISALTQNAAKAAGYFITGAVRRNDGTTSLVGAIVKDTFELGSTAAWDAAVQVTVSPVLGVVVTGEAATNILWSATVRRRITSYPG